MHVDEDEALRGVEALIEARVRKLGSTSAETRIWQEVLLAFHAWFVNEINRGTRPTEIANAIASVTVNMINSFASTLANSPEERTICMDEIVRVVQHSLDDGGGNRESVVTSAVPGGHA